WEVVILSLLVIPAVFGLVYLALPLWRARGLVAVGLAAGRLAPLLQLAHLVVFAHFAKLGARASLGVCVLRSSRSAPRGPLPAPTPAPGLPAPDAYRLWRKVRGPQAWGALRSERGETVNR